MAIKSETEVRFSVFKSSIWRHMLHVLHTVTSRSNIISSVKHTLWTTYTYISRTAAANFVIMNLRSIMNITSQSILISEEDGIVSLETDLDISVE